MQLLKTRLAPFTVAGGVLLCLGPVPLSAQVVKHSCTPASLPAAVLFAKVLSEEDQDKGDYASALSYAEQYRDYCQSDAWGWEHIGHLLLLQRQYGQATRALLSAAQLEPNSAQIHYLLMLSYRGLRDEKKMAVERREFQRLQAASIPASSRSPSDPAERSR